MNSPKNGLLVLLFAFSTAFAALGVACTVSADPEFEVDIYDVNQNPLVTYFDYYLDVFTVDGTRLTFHEDSQLNNINGAWSLTDPSATFFSEPSGVECQDTCVTSGKYGCSEFASDCWSGGTEYKLDPSQITGSAASIGIPTAGGYVVYSSSKNLDKFTAGGSAMIQHDQFDTNIEVIGLSGEATLKKATGAPIDTKNLSLSSKKEIHGGIQARPTMIKDLSKLSPAQMQWVNKARKLFKRPNS